MWSSVCNVVQNKKKNVLMLKFLKGYAFILGFFFLEGVIAQRHMPHTDIMENHRQVKSHLHMESFTSGQSQTTQQKIEQKQTE